VFAAGLMDYVYKDMVTDLTPYIEKDKYDQSDFQSSAVQTFTFGKKQFGVPRGGIPTGIFYNKDLFDKAGLPYPPSDWEDPSWTWDKMLEYAKKLTLDTNGDGKIDQWGISLQFQHHGSLPLIWGKQIFPDDAFKYGITTQHFFRDPVVVNAYQQAADLIHKHKVNPAADITKDLGFFGPFMSGQVAMYGNLCAYVQPSTAKFKWSVAAVPRGAPTIQQKSLTFTGPFLVGKGCSNPDMAWELVKYLTSGEGQKTIAQGAVVGTSRKSLTDWWLGQFGAPAKDLATVQAGGYKYGIESPNVRSHVVGRKICAAMQ
jgi:multiple sugar transport system substrate-binding protein